MEKKEIVDFGRHENYLRQSQVLKAYPISYFHLKKLRDEKVINTYRVLASERDIYYKKEELDLVVYRMFPSNDESEASAE